MTQTGINREQYAQAHKNTDPRPSRFANIDRYREWAARADAWAAVN